MFQTLGQLKYLKDKQEQIFSITDKKRLFLYLGLSQLVVVMGKSEIKSSTVDVHGLSQDRARHGRTLNMPAWPSLSQQSTKQSILYHSRQDPHFLLGANRYCPAVKVMYQFKNTSTSRIISHLSPWRVPWRLSGLGGFPQGKIIGGLFLT